MVNVRKAEPEVEVIEVTGRLEKWYVNTHPTNGTMHICGLLFDDVRKRWRNGEYIFTSYFPIRDVKEGDIVKTKNSVYLLGEPSVYE